MMIIKWILLIALFKYSHEQKSFPNIKTFLDSTTTTVKPKTFRLVTTHVAKDPSAPVESCGVDKECINFLLCNNGTVITDGDNLIDLRDDLNNVCSHYLDVCCDAPNIKTTSGPIVIRNPIATKCGVLNPSGVGIKIKEIIDHEAQFGEFPWMVAVLKEVDTFGMVSYESIGGGSLIHPSVVLTVGHKVVGLNPLTLTVRAGEWDTQTAREPFPFVESIVASMKVHEKLQRGTGTNNLALLFLATPIANAEHINTICLPPPNTIFDGARCFVTGWGKDKFGEDGSYQAILKKIDLPVFGRQNCTEMFRKTRLGKNYVLNESLICAGGEPGKDSCKGDGGAPLVCPVPGNEGYFYQAGIVAWGIGCGEDNTPGAYTNVAFFADWIDKQMQDKGFKNSTYTF